MIATISSATIVLICMNNWDIGNRYFVPLELQDPGTFQKIKRETILSMIDLRSYKVYDATVNIRKKNES